MFSDSKFILLNKLSETSLRSEKRRGEILELESQARNSFSENASKSHHYSAGV